MAAVVFGPEQARRRSRPRTGLVLGAGGVLGAAWMTGALACLQDRLADPLGDADVIVGTSAGSVLAAALRCRATVSEMVAWQRGEATGALRESVVLAARDGPFPPLPYLRPARCRWHGRPCSSRTGCRRWWPRAPGCRTAAASTSRCEPWSTRCTGVPAVRGAPGAGGTDPRRSADLGAGSTPGSPRWTMTPGSACCSASRAHPAASLPDAVVASCSIPGWYSPAIIGGRRYVDGGVRSATSLDVLAGTDVQEIYVLAPLASTQADQPLQPHLRIERQIRQLLTRAVLRQARALAAQGKRVTVLTPGPADLAAMGINLMDPRRRQAVLETSFRTSAAALAQLGPTRSRAA